MESKIKTLGKLVNNLIDSGWALNMSWKVVASHFVLVKWTYLWSFNFTTKYYIYVLSSRWLSDSLTCILDLFYILHALFSFPIQVDQNILCYTKFLVKSPTSFLFSPLNLPASMCLSNFGAFLWLWTPLRITNDHSFVSLRTYQYNLNRHPHFLDPVVHASLFSWVLFTHHSFYSPTVTLDSINWTFQ